LTVVPAFSEKRRREQIPIIEKTFAKYERVKSIFQQKSKKFLENAIDYYYRSLGDERLEEKIIDLMISLESLFSNEKDELGLRYSLRVAFLLGVDKEQERPTIFKTIHSLYGKRSAVVHGTGNVKLEYSEISALQGYVREAIKRLIHIEMPKQDFISLLDESVHNAEKTFSLNDIVREAIKKW
jgi:hypothetical protein